MSFGFVLHPVGLQHVVSRRLALLHVSVHPSACSHTYSRQARAGPPERRPAVRCSGRVACVAV